MSPPVVRRLAPNEIRPACVVLGLAFADNPSALTNVRGNRANAQRMMQRTVRAVKLGTPYSHVLVAEDHGDIVGVLNAAPWPHCQLRPIDKVTQAPKMLRAAGTAMPRVSKMASARAKHDPGEPHWHIGPLGVHPDHQRRGIGKSLLAMFLRTADEQAMYAFLETDVDKNVELYEQFGFVVTASEPILGVDTRFMSRAPHRPVPEKG
jgi:ribosomal protein S18 acetylase RimI-like enzyme